MGELPVAVIGAGPVGLAAAAHLLERNLEPLVLEAGDGPAYAVSQWGHVRLFSAWPELIDTAATRLLTPSGWTAPAAEGYPTAAEWIASYLRPLAGALGGHVRYGVQVTGVSRRGRDRLVDAGRAGQPFTVHVAGPAGTESRLEARAIIDASGTWGQPAPAGADGLPALGERAAAGVLSYRLPSFASAEAFAGRHTVVLGSGHSALTAISELARIVQDHPGTRVSWALRRGGVGTTFGGGDGDQLPERGALGTRAREAVEAGLVDVVTGFRTERVQAVPGALILVSEDGRSLPAADQVLVLAGFRPDLSFLSEMRLELDVTLQAPVKLAAEIDPNLHSCGDVAATGAAELAHPEPDLYLAGMKSYGRGPTFLAMTGYEQVRSIAAELAGDHEAAARVELVLPDTGVCGGTGLFDEPAEISDGACCAPAPQIVQIGRAPAAG
ncbi:MAG: NAD(P)-binding domain-containing protein [Streptosporangiaceae bacterium]|jgi:thioredoxin reductase